MKTKKKIMVASIAIAVGILSNAAYAQEVSIKVIDRTSIELTGAKTVAELLTALPQFQGNVTASQSVNGGSRGEQTVSLHAAGDAYTLVLLNGRRIASFNTGTVNLSSIPLASIEKVELLTGGAAAKYGSDAIAAVNLVTKRKQTDYVTEFTYSTPQQAPAGKTQAFNISKGWGDYSTNGFNVTAQYSHSESRALLASDRTFTEDGGLTRFSEAGKRYSLYQVASSSQPANVTIFGKNEVKRINSYLVTNGKCFGSSVQVASNCSTNYSTQVDLLPATVQDSITSSVDFKVNDHLKIFADGLLSKSTITSAYSSATQPFVLNANSSLFKSDVLPAYRAAGGNQEDKVIQANVFARLDDAGRRTNGYETNFKHLTLGADGDAFGWDYKANYTFSENKAIDNALNGYVSKNALDRLIASGTWSPFKPASEAGKVALAPAVLKQVLDTSTNSIDVINFDASRDVFNLAGGTAKLGVGIEYRKQKYSDNPSAISQGANMQQPEWTDINVGGYSGALPSEASRTNTGTFATINMPLTTKWNVATLVRYDTFGAVQNEKPFDIYGNLLSPTKQGKKQSAGTFNVSTDFKVSDTLLYSSYGTNFKPVDMQNVSAPLRGAGYSQAREFVGCIIAGRPLSHLQKACVDNAMYQDGNHEFPLFVGGNSDLKGESSKNFELGFKSEISKDASISFNLWDVRIKNQLASMNEDMIFSDVVRNGQSLIDYVNPQTDLHEIGVILSPANLASSHYRGVDWDNSYRMTTSIGKVTFNWTGTYMLKADSDSGITGETTEKSIGRFDRNGNVTFRVQSRLAALWSPSDRYAHSLTMGYRSGYVDQVYSADDSIVRAVNSDGTIGDYVDSKRKVGAYYTFDWQSKIHYSKNLTVTAGIKNLFNQDPPFSQRTTGGGSQLGYDGRYTDPLGRQFYVVGNLNF